MMYLAHIVSAAMLAFLLSLFVFKDKTWEAAVTSAVFAIILRVICFAVWPLK